MMRSPWRALAFGVVIALGVVLGADIVNLSAQASDPRIGAWKLNVAKSKYSPGPAPRSFTVKVEASGQGEKATTEGVNAEGALRRPSTRLISTARTIRLLGPRTPTRFHSSESTHGPPNSLPRRTVR